MEQATESNCRYQRTVPADATNRIYIGTRADDAGINVGAGFRLVAHPLAHLGLSGGPTSHLRDVVRGSDVIAFVPAAAGWKSCGCRSF
jgi:hypothetical protein